MPCDGAIISDHLGAKLDVLEVATDLG